MSFDPFDGVGLISDPIHGYIKYTCRKASQPGEITEEALIDNPWMQRLRYIHQLQSAFWVYPSAEHSRFQHSIGSMHVAGRFADRLFETIQIHHSDCPSRHYVKELLRIAGLLHDVGHGPFGHLFDSNYLEPVWNINHEIVGTYIIKAKLSNLIRAIRRSPSGEFKTGEPLEPRFITYLIKRPDKTDAATGLPNWLRHLRLLFSGIYTVDNLDFVLRDAYMTGFSIDPIDLDRILHYTFVSEEGITYSSHGLPSLIQFINARIDLFNSVYYHRTTRAIDYSLKNIFYETFKLICPNSPLDKPDEYLNVTEWNLFHTVREWARSRTKKLKKLGQKWLKILNREREWVTAYEKSFPLVSTEHDRFVDLFFRRDPNNIRHLEKLVRDGLPSIKRDLNFVVDLASQDPRPDNPLDENQAISIFNHSTKRIGRETLRELLENIPYRIIKFRILAPDHKNDKILSRAAESAISAQASSFTTNI